MVVRGSKLPKVGHNFKEKVIVNWIHTMKKNIYTIDNAIDILYVNWIYIIKHLCCLINRLYKKRRECVFMIKLIESQQYKQSEI